MTAPPGFDAKAARYDELRPVDEHWWQAFDRIVAAGDLRRRRVLEIGCGTGRFAQALEERELARVWAVDVSPQMVARAKELGVNARTARAETLPFRRGWFDRAVMRMVVHLLVRPRAFAEIARVLGADGRLVVATEDPATFDEIWLTRLFPSIPQIERGRFPDEPDLARELAEAGFASTTFDRFDQTRSFARDHALATIREKAYSTFDLLPPDEYAEGLARAEAELPDRFEHRFRWLLAVADRAPR